MYGIIEVFCTNTTGTCSLASAKKIHEHNGVDPSESPDVIMYHSPERCVCVSVHLCLSVCMSVHLCVCRTDV